MKYYNKPEVIRKSLSELNSVYPENKDFAYITAGSGDIAYIRNKHTRETYYVKYLSEGKRLPSLRVQFKVSKALRNSNLSITMEDSKRYRISEDNRDWAVPKDITIKKDLKSAVLFALKLGR